MTTCAPFRREDLTRLQTAVHLQIGETLSYWPATAGATRLLEEVGEVNELYLRRCDDNSLHEELADVILISTCLANQYCIHLDDWWHHYERPNDVTGYSHHSRQVTGRWICHLTSVAGDIARSVNAYEGFKAPKTSEDIQPLGYWIAALHGHIRQLLVAQGHDLVPLSQAVLDAKTQRDADRFAGHFDPSTAQSLASFRTIQENTRCPFAPAARLWGTPDWSLTDDVITNVSRLVPVMMRFCMVLRWETLDGIVAEITDRKLFSDIDTLAATLKTFLVALSSRDPACATPFSSTVRSEDWQFEFGGHRLFVIVFAPIYESDSTRETYGGQSTFVLLQPEKSFRNLKIPRDANAPVKRHQIRDLFAQAGKSYECLIVNQPFEAPRYLKPLHVGQPEVQWWK